jgi:hypothetical protein
MGTDDCGGVEFQGALYYLTWMHFGSIQRAYEHIFDANHAMSRGEEGDGEDFAFVVG